MVLLTLFVIIFLLIFFWLRHRYSYFKRHGFLHDPPSFPFGNLKGIGGTIHPAHIFQKIYTKYKGKSPVAGIFFFLSPNVMVTDLDVVKDVLIRDFDVFHNRGLYSNEKDDPLTGHIFAIEDQAWKNMRNKLTPTFTSGKMKMMFNTVLEVSDHMIEHLKKQTASTLEMFEVKNSLANFTTDVIGNIAFGLEMNAIEDPNSKFRVMGRKLFAPENNFFLKALLLTSFRDLGRKLHMKLIPADLSEFFLTSIRQTLNYRIDSKIERNDFFSLMVKMYQGEGKEGESLNFNQIAANCFIFFNAGFETSSTTSTFVLYHLAVNQEIQERVRDEIQEVLKKEGGKITYEGIKEMKYLQMVVDETLRISGPVVMLLRVASRDYEIPKTSLTIEKGSLTMVPIYAIHNDPEIYPNPSLFDPERFTEENKAKRHPMAFLPFGDGPRNCIGLRFGYMQTKIAIIQLLLNFRFKTTEKTPIPLVFNPTSPILAPIDGMWLKMEKL